MQYIKTNWIDDKGTTLSNGIVLGANVRIVNPANVSIGNNTTIGPGTYFCPLGSAGKIIVGNDCLLTQFAQIYSQQLVVIGNKVMIAANVFMADVTHVYTDGSIPYIEQGFTEPKPIYIEDGCWIEVGAFYWTDMALDIVNPGREEQGSVSV